MQAPVELLPSARSQRNAAVALLLIQAVAIGALMQAPMFSIAIATIALVGSLAPQYGMLRDVDRTRWFVFTGIFFGIKAIFAPTEFDFNINFVNTALAYEIASFCMVLQILTLFMKRYAKRLPLWILGLSLVALIFTADVRVNNLRRMLTLTIVACFLVAWTYFAATSRQPVNQERRRSWTRFIVSGGVLFAAVVLGSSIATALHRNERQLESALTAYLALGEPTRAETGFSGRGGLSDVTEWKKAGRDTLALRVISKNAPGYLRGKVFDTFEKQRWSLQTEAIPLAAIPLPSNTVTPDFESATYVLRPGIWERDDTEYNVVEVWPVDDNSAGHFFLPLNTAAFWSMADRVQVDQHQVPTRRDRGEVHPYKVLTTNYLNKQPTEISPLYTTLPNSVDDRVIQAVDDLNLSGKSNQQKIAAIRNFFHANFEYKLGIRIKRGEDRLGYFIAEKLPAHCEYFASATTVMLRLAGVPARYVTGYVCQEKNAVDGSWLSRRQDAHAWVEAYDDATSEWVIVESTPEGGVPEQRNAGIRANMLESMMHRVRSFQYKVRTGDVWGVVWSAIFPLLYLLGAIIFVLILFQLRSLFQKKNKQTKRDATWIDPRLPAERRRMDKYVARFGLIRDEHEPLLQFAKRIEQRVTVPNNKAVAEWYRKYVALRFDDEQNVDQELSDLSNYRKEISKKRKPTRVLQNST